MKRNICLLGGIILLLFIWSTNSLAAYKIGFINMREIIQNSTEGKKAREDLSTDERFTCFETARPLAAQGSAAAG